MDRARSPGSPADRQSPPRLMGRDVAKRMYAPWRDRSTLPTLWDFYTASRENHVSTIEELEMLQEAGFHRLEVIRSATMHAAETLYRPLGREPEAGVVREGMRFGYWLPVRRLAAERGRRGMEASWSVVCS